MVDLVNSGLLEVFIKLIEVEVINDHSQNSEDVSFAHFYLNLCVIFRELRFHDEYFILFRFQLLFHLLWIICLLLIKTYINLRMRIVVTLLTWKVW